MTQMTSVNLEFISDDKRHLICVPYSIDNLHRMAQRLNIARCWFHSGRFPHYDIPKKRVEEIRNKTSVIQSKELLMIIKKGE